MCAHIAVPVQTSKGTPLPSFLKGVVDPVTVNVPEPFWDGRHSPRCIIGSYRAGEASGSPVVA